MKKVRLQSVIWKEGEHYVAQCLDVDVSSFGTSRHEALMHLQEALDLFYEDERIEPIAQVKNPRIVSVSVPSF